MSIPEIRNDEMAHVHMVAPRLTLKQQQVVIMFHKGMTKRAIAKALSYPVSQIDELIHSEDAIAAKHALENQAVMRLSITRDRLAEMLLESHAKAGTAAEEIQAIRELGKLYDLYESDKNNSKNVAVQVVNNIHSLQNKKQVERLSDEELFKLAGDKIKSLKLHPVAQRVDDE